MPNCIEFKRKSTGEVIALDVLDAEIACHLGTLVHPTRWCYGWYDVIGFDFAMGADFNKVNQNIGAYFPECSGVLIQISNFLETNFTVRAWYSSKKD